MIPFNLCPFYRKIPEWEAKEKLTYSHNLLTCNISGLPMEALTHASIRRSNIYTIFQCTSKNKTKLFNEACSQETFRTKCTPALVEECYERIKWAQKNTFSNAQSEDNQQDFNNFAQCRQQFYQRQVRPCEHKLQDICRKTTITAYKGLRLTMYEIDQFLNKDPDMKVIYLIRDPRSILSSRIMHHYVQIINDKVLEAKHLCVKMLEDWEHFLTLKQSKHKDALMLIRYEDLISNTVEIAEDVYKFLEQPIHQKVTKFLHESKSDVHRQLNKWKENIEPKYHHAISDVCKEVLIKMKYPLD